MDSASQTTVIAIFMSVHAARRAKMLGVYRAARRLNWNLRMLQIHNRFTETLADALAHVRPDGVILDGEEFDRMPAGIRRGTPVVTIDPRPTFKSPWAIRHDSQASVIRAADELLKFGFSDYAFVGTIPDVYWSHRRERQFVSYVHDNGGRCHVYRPSKAERDGRNDSRRLGAWLRALPKPCGLHAVIDLRGAQVLEACQEQGISVPEEIAVIGSDNDEPLCESTWPPLASVEPDFVRSGERAAELLDALIGGRDPSGLPRTYGPLRAVLRASARYDTRNVHNLKHACEYIRTHAMLGISVPDVVQQMGTSRRTAETTFRNELQHSILEEIQLARLARVEESLLDPRKPISLVAAACGYSTDLHLKRLFKARYGMSMSAWRAAHT